MVVAAASHVDVVGYGYGEWGVIVCAAIHIVCGACDCRVPVVSSYWIDIVAAAANATVVVHLVSLC